MPYPKDGYPDQKYLRWLPEAPYGNMHGGENALIAAFVAPDGRFYQLMRGHRSWYGLCYDDDPLIIRMATNPDVRYWSYKRAIYATAQYPLTYQRQLREILHDPRIHVREISVADSPVYEGRPAAVWEKGGHGRGRLRPEDDQRVRLRQRLEGLDG